VGDRDLSRLSGYSAGHEGKQVRVGRLFRPETSRCVVATLDDALIGGPRGQLEDVPRFLRAIEDGGVDAVLAFPGLFKNFGSALRSVGRILNVTASTVRSAHTRKVLVSRVEHALILGCDAVAVHINIGSRYESEMLQLCGTVAGACEGWGVPLLVISYPRGEQPDGADDNYGQVGSDDRERYTDLVVHAARLAVELGADIVKTQYTGDQLSFARVVAACRPVPVVIAGGPVREWKDAVARAKDAVRAGAAGASYGRNLFMNVDPRAAAAELALAVHGGIAETLQQVDAKRL
jgi:fructose-bisphosphate aldolase/2-amino-3,7-dideoxy-D-threo-hept-6-ulosonate synthase